MAQAVLAGGSPVGAMTWYTAGLSPSAVSQP